MADQARTIVNVGSVRPYRTAKQKRQVLVAAAVVALVAAIGAGAYKLLAPGTKTTTLQSWDSATVETGSLVQSTQASGTVALPAQMSLASPEAGYAAKLYVTEGDTVKKGQVLVRLEVPDLENDLEDLQSSLADAQRAYQKTVATNGVDIDRKVREIAALETDIAVAQAEVTRVEKLVAINGARQSELDATSKALAALAASKKEKELQLAEQRQLNSLDEQSAQAKIADLKVQVQRLEARIKAATISSPMDGEVLSVAPALAVSGSAISSGASLFTIADPSSAIVELEVDEQYSSLLTIGQQVKLTVGSAGLSGRITAIGKVAEQSSDGLGATVSVKVKPESGTTTLLLGNTAVGQIDLGTTENALLLPRGPYLTTGSSRWLYVIEGSMARRVAVTFGTTTATTVQVLSGVSAGEKVITSGYQNYIEYEQVQLAKGE